MKGKKAECACIAIRRSGIDCACYICGKGTEIEEKIDTAHISISSEDY